MRCLKALNLAFRMLDHSVNKKSCSICDLGISKHLDILVLIETWPTSESK